MKVYELYPEVAGNIDEDVITDVTTRPIGISSMHYSFDGWLGDDLLTEAGYFIVTERLAKELLKSNLNGFQIKEAIISKSEQFEEMYPDRALPNFNWLYINGQERVADFWFSKAAMRLTLSDRAMAFLKKFNISNCDIEEKS